MYWSVLHSLHTVIHRWFLNLLESLPEYEYFFSLLVFLAKHIRKILFSLMIKLIYNLVNNIYGNGIETIGTKLCLLQGNELNTLILNKRPVVRFLLQFIHRYLTIYSKKNQRFVKKISPIIFELCPHQARPAGSIITYVFANPIPVPRYTPQGSIFESSLSGGIT